MKSLKVCFLMPSHYSAAVGGAELQVHYLMDYMRANTGHQLTMICRDAAVSDDNGIPIYRIKSVPPFHRHFKLADFFSIFNHLRTLDPDIVYTRTSTPYVGIAAWYCRRYKKKLVYHIAHVEDVTPFQLRSCKQIPRRLERPIYQYGLRRANAIVAQAEYQRTLLAERYGLPCTVVMANVHPAAAAFEKEADQPTVLWVNNLKATKRPELFVELARKCQSLSGIQFLMIGAIQDPTYAELFQSNSAPKNLRYLGKQAVEDVNRLLMSAELLVNTSAARSEGFPNTFIQAWLRGVPVVSLAVNPDGVLTDETIGVCCGDRLDRMVNEVRRLLSDNALRARIGKAAQRIAAERYSMKGVETLISVFEGL